MQRQFPLVKTVPRFAKAPEADSITAVDAVLDTLIRGLGAACDGQAKERMLVLGARPHVEFHTWKQVAGWQPIKPWADAWEAASFTLLDLTENKKWPVVACLPGKSKEETLFTFALARGSVEEGGIILTALSNQAGAARFEKHFAKATGNAQSLSKNKCRAFWATHNDGWDNTMFSEWRKLGQPAIIAETNFQTVPGVFSAGRIDPGSQFLVENLPRDLRGSIADLGAAWGFLSDHVLHHYPKVESVDLYEFDSRALSCAKRNLATHGNKATFHWHDVTQGIARTYDAIIMNPPFHTGQDQDMALGQAFLTSAARGLRRNGRLFIVANRQLPYENHLDSLGLRWRNAGETSCYKLLFASA